ncbi:polysaccharide biosynthesis protein [Hymenobacter aerilatus]|uniref:Polysaccharide biosynthesis protein n=1 Tax=Hymenobacter aerilatus TaxID=2932251 RepID=A0A8T9SQQ1_9BACT|nr:polysaccharide biosynthesis protein [Hymenobacter aerilatus]UOR04478.1 polysaccharide biosynthesis protein [Hymenobacter aerilatus]
MKVLTQRIQTSSKAAKLLEWGKLVTVMGSAQIALQALGFVGGILVIRLLPTQEYALYTLANTMLGTMVLLADGGISTGVMAQGGQVWQDRERLGVVLATGMDLRRKFAIISLLVATPALIYLLRHQNASWLLTILLTLSLIPAFFTALSGTLWEIAPKLHQRIGLLQSIQVGASIGRLILLGASLFLFPWSYIAVLAAGIPQIWANFRLRKLAHTLAAPNQPIDPVIRQDILNKVKRLLPDAIYYCFSAQFAVWVMSIFGSTTAVASLGALGRLAVALSLFTAMFSALVLPRFARLPYDSALLMRQFSRIITGMLLLCAAIVGGVWLFSTPILWVLGRQYANLESEIVLMMIGKCIGLVAYSAFSLCTSKGWVINPIVSISLSMASIVCGAFFVDVTSLRGIFILDIFVAAVQLIMHLVYGYLQFHSAKPVSELSEIE